MNVLRLLIVLCALSVHAEYKVLLLNDTSDWYHWGCTGTSTALKERIQKLGYKVSSIPIYSIKTCTDVPTTIAGFNDVSLFEQFSVKNAALIRAISESDLLVINGEGTLHGCNFTPTALLYLAYSAKKYLQKHVEIINHSAYPQDDLNLDQPFPKELYQMVYSQLDFIAIREILSLDLMNTLGIRAEPSFDCLPLFIQDHYHTPKKQGQKTIVLAGSVAWTESGLEKILSYLLHMQKQGFHIQVLTGASAYPAKDDQKLLDFLHKKAPQEWEFINAPTIEAWLDTINHASLLLSGRFHHSIAAFCLHTPFITLNSNTPKIPALLQMLQEMPPLSYDDETLLEQLLTRTELVLTKKASRNIHSIYELGENNFLGLKRFLEKAH